MTILPVKMKIVMPQVPNFFRTADGGTVPVWSVNDDDLRVIGTLWTSDLIQKSHQQAKERLKATGDKS